MAKKSFKDLVLVLIYQTSGKWTWYQIERELGWRHIGGRINAVTIIGKLIDNGYVEEKQLPEKAGNPVYIITDEGVKKVQSLIQENGVEYYMQKVEKPEDYDYMT